MLYELIGYASIFALTGVNGGFRGFKMEGKKLHGFNIFNGEAVTDYNPVSPVINTMGSIPMLLDNNGEIITAETDRDMIPLTNDAFHTTFYKLPLPGFSDTYCDVSESFLNLPYRDVGSLAIPTATDFDQREPIMDWSAKLGAFRASKEYPSELTLGMIEGVEGKMFVKCSREEGSTENSVRFVLTNGIPNSVYSIWEMGLIDGELAPHAGPIILPNVIITDYKGRGEETFKSPYCPLDEHVPAKGGNANGGTPVTYIVAWHPDFATWGGAPDLGRFCPPATGGIVTLDVLEFPIFEFHHPPESSS